MPALSCGLEMIPCDYRHPSEGNARRGCCSLNVAQDTVSDEKNGLPLNCQEVSGHLNCKLVHVSFFQVLVLINILLFHGAKMPQVFFIRRKQHRGRTKEGGGAGGLDGGEVSYPGRYRLILIKSRLNVEAVEVAGAEAEVRLTLHPPPRTFISSLRPCDAPFLPSFLRSWTPLSISH